MIIGRVMDLVSGLVKNLPIHTNQNFNKSIYFEIILHNIISS